MAHGPRAGLPLLDELEQRGELREYYLLPAARGDLLRRLGEWASASVAYRRALGMANHNAERNFLGKRLREMESQLAHGPGKPEERDSGNL